MNMELMLGACGLACNECDAFLATQENNPEKIAEIAKQWSKEYGGEFQPASIWCDGCMAESDRKCGHCAECDIRACVSGKGLSSCGECSDYACDRISRFFENVPCCKGRLDAVKGQ
jgi:hypothetical protein